jgi:hypothetical protein
VDRSALAGAVADIRPTSASARRSLIPRSHFTRIADHDDVDAKTVERDYVLTHVLAGICQQPDSRRIVFNGGTALRLCFFEDYRYSADLDFSLRDGMTIGTALDLVRAALISVADKIAFPQLALIGDGKHIEYTGPLGRHRAVKLDMADDELVEDTAPAALLPRYPDQPDVHAMTYTLEEIAAEKLRCVIQRVQARDLFDLKELSVGRALDADSIWPSFERKAAHKGIDPGRFAALFEQRIPDWRARWHTEMEGHVAGEPEPFGTVEREVRRALRA